MKWEKVVIALGGNAILRPNQEATFENQLSNVEASCVLITEMVQAGHKVIVTHGNGPQVGNILRQNEEAKGLFLLYQWTFVVRNHKDLLAI